MSGKANKKMKESDDLKEFISVIKRAEAAKVYINDIIYIESEARRIHIYTADDKYSIYRKMDEIAEKLPADFYRCHKSCIINLSKVKNMKERLIYFECGTALSVCAEKYTKAVQAYKGYLIRNEKHKERVTKKA